MSRSRSVLAVVAALVTGAVAQATLAGQFAAAEPPDAELPVVVPIEPCRVFDTRAEFNVGTKATPFGPGEAVTFSGRGPVGACAPGVIPDDATGIVLNVTAVGPTAATFLEIGPAGVGETGDTSMLNPVPGLAAVPNSITIDLNETGEFSVYNFRGYVDVLADATAYLVDHSHPEIVAQIAELATHVDDNYVDQAALESAIAQTYAPWNELPSGVTVRGGFYYDGDLALNVGEQFGSSIDLPGLAPVVLSTNDVNFAADDDADTSDDDETCTGTFDAPTAPSGTVCLYLGDHGPVSGLEGRAGSLPHHGFRIVWTAKTPGLSPHVEVNWAYTAP